MDDSRVTVLEGTSSEIATVPMSATPSRVLPEPEPRGIDTHAAPPKRMRSMNLTLVLMGTAALGGLTGCGNLESNKGTSRDVYANLEACKADWGNPGDCEEVASSTPGHSNGAIGSRGFYGPRYSSRSGSSSGYSSEARPGSRASGTVSSSSVSRGGFGASASRHSGGSSSHSSGG